MVLKAGAHQVETQIRLSEMEARIIERIAAGERTSDIAQKVYLSRQGVEFHVSKLLQRFRVPNRPALIAKAYSLGILGRLWPPRVEMPTVETQGMRQLPVA